MKKSILFSFSVLLLFSFLLTSERILSQESNHVFGVGIGKIAYSDDIVHVEVANDDFWLKYKSDITLNASYAYKVFPYFRIGGYFEYEKSTLSDDFLGDSKGSRIDLGIQWLGEYPAESNFRVQLGGYFGYSMLSNKDWDETPKGMSYGIMAGPCYNAGKISVALHVHAGLSNYFGDQVENVNNLAPRVYIKVFYNL
ncbi:MAG: hypothetical protein EHM93_02660 [Bacteroidales bacterium]|nr:MAG: hypothetical protein EHM93_02660 [Bacteroidales bacterium]